MIIYVANLYTAGIKHTDKEDKLHERLSVCKLQQNYHHGNAAVQ